MRYIWSDMKSIENKQLMISKRNDPVIGLCAAQTKFEMTYPTGKVPTKLLCESFQALKTLMLGFARSNEHDCRPEQPIFTVEGQR